MSILSEFNGDVHAVLRYAFRTSARPILAASSFFRQLQSTGIKVSGGRSMGQHEHHAQAAAIMWAIDQLEPLQQAVIYGWHDGRRRDAAVELLREKIHGPANFPARLEEMLIREWLDTDGRKIGRQIGRIQKKMVDDGELPRAFTRGQLWYARKLIFDQLDQLDIAAKNNLAAYWARD